MSVSDSVSSLDKDAISQVPIGQDRKDGPLSGIRECVGIWEGSIGLVWRGRKLGSRGTTGLCNHNIQKPGLPVTI